MVLDNQGQRVKRLWIVNHHAALPSKDGRYGRHLALALHLRSHGWESTLFVASTTHPSGEQRATSWRIVRRTCERGIDTIWIRTNAYGSSMARRVVGMVIFALGILAPSTTRHLARPDVIVGSTVHLLAAWAAWRLARRYRVPFVFEIRDIWPETLIDLGQLRPNGVPARLMRQLCLRLCKAADLVISPLPGVQDFLIHNGCFETPFAWIPNGIEPVDPIEEAVPPSKPEFVMMYLGSLGNANGIDVLLDAFDAAHSTGRLDGVILRLVGDGSKRVVLRSRAEKLSSGKWIFFEDRIPRHDVLTRAREADCLVVCLEDLPVYRYGISLNKIFDYLLASRPILIASSALNNPVSEANAGISVPAGDVLALAEAMGRIREMSDRERLEMGLRGRAHVLSRYTYSNLARDMAGKLEGLVCSSDAPIVNEGPSLRS